MSSQPFPVPVEIISDEDEKQISKKRKTTPTVVILDDDILDTPKIPNNYYILDNTPIADHVIFKSDSPTLNKSSVHSAVSNLICLESDDESEGGIGRKYTKEIEDSPPDHGLDDIIIMSSHAGSILGLRFWDLDCAYSDTEDKAVLSEQVANALMQSHKGFDYDEEQTREQKRKNKEEKIRVAEERKLKREQEKLQKKALKAEAAEARKLQKEQQKWEKGKLSLKSIVAVIDAKVVELGSGSIGGQLLSMFAEKGLSFRITSNPIEGSILWTRSFPEELSELSAKGSEIPYVMLIYEADEFCNLVINESFMSHVSSVRSHYSSYTVCYLTNKLMAYINKREQAQYKKESNSSLWRRPPVEEVLSKLTTEFNSVHSRHCRDESELADHVVGLTTALATCQYRKKLTRLSVNAEGLVPKDFIDRDLIRKSSWLKCLVAIPKVQPRCAIAIGKIYPTMKSLLSVYMDTSKSVHEKEFLLEDIPMEDLLGNIERKVGAVCSKRVYRILMAENGNIKSEDVENGADSFKMGVV
ncbi:hypothetical protein ACHQM5_020748 [Ranunculus cassubicifolius]